jgi:cleavage and polyadenylation specificity factor subunit 1
MKEAVRVRKQVEADLGGFDVEQEWVEEIEREDCFAIDAGLGLAPSIPIRKYELWLADASSRWNILDKYQLDEFEHGTALKVMYLTDVSSYLVLPYIFFNNIHIMFSMLLIGSSIQGC